MRRWAVLAAVAAIGLCGASQPPEQREKAATERQDADTRSQAAPKPLVVEVVPTPKTASETNAEQRENERKAGLERGGLITNIALAVFAFLQLIVTGITLFGLRHARIAAEAADKAADAAKASIDSLAAIERAYVFGGILDVVADSVSGATSFNFIIHNAGRTPARVRAVHLAMEGVSSSGRITLPDVRDYSKATLYPTDTMFAGGEKGVVLDIHDRPTFGIVYGYIEYEDIFKVLHRSLSNGAQSGPPIGAE